MGYATDYLQSPRMTQDLTQLMPQSIHKDLEHANQQMVYALLRWQQWFENPYVKKEEIKLCEPTLINFRNYCDEILELLKDQDVSIAQINDVLINHAKKMLAHGPDFNDRLVKLITMGACEYHGFNGYFTNSIKRCGLDPQAKFLSKEKIAPIKKILYRVGGKNQLGYIERDQKRIYVSPDPKCAYNYAKISPEWFYLLCAGYTLNYKKARERILIFQGQEKLTANERNTILEFFDEWWEKLITNGYLKDNYLKIASMPMFRDKQTLQNRIRFNLKGLQLFGYEKMIDYLMNGDMYSQYEHIYEQPIKPEFMQIINVPSVQTHNQKLFKLQNVFHKDNLQQNKDNMNQLAAG